MKNKIPYLKYFILFVTILSTSYFLYQLFYLSPTKDKSPPLSQRGIPTKASQKIGPTLEEQKEILSPQEKKKIAKAPIRYNRRLIGKDVASFENPQMMPNLINKVNPLWKKKLHHRLTRFNANTKVTITPLEPLLQIENKNRGRFIEYVKIERKLPNGEVVSNLAFIDSEKGKTIDSWNYTKFCPKDHQHIEYIAPPKVIQ